jgi:hypothetical protein
MSALPTSLSLSPQDAAIISFLGKGLLSGEIGQATEQVAHWKHFFDRIPAEFSDIFDKFKIRLNKMPIGHTITSFE